MALGSIRRHFFRLVHLLERIAAYIQGKGYGSATIAQEVKLLQQLLGREPQLAIDIGGNVGAYTGELRRRNPKLEIHIFEPSATNIAKLTHRFKDDSLVKLVPMAVSKEAGAATLFSNEPGSGLGSLTHRRLEHLNIPFETKETIQTLRFEDYWNATLGRRQLDIVKMDIEGHELAAMEGFGAAIDVTQVLQFEFGGCNVDTRTFFRDFWYFLRERGFDVYRITPFGAEELTTYRERDEFFSTTNYIAAKSSLRAASAHTA
jgi:FkbM family methyltransferase